MFTDRLELRPPVEDDRARFVELFCDPDFMAFTGKLTAQLADDRFTHMLDTATEVPFAKQPVIERSTGSIVGYCGVDWFDFDGERSLEFGYRLCVAARGRGYATEAGLALLDLARQNHTGTIYAMIDPTNGPSMRVIDKLGFTFWKQHTIDDYLDNLYRLQL